MDPAGCVTGTFPSNSRSGPRGAMGALFALSYRPEILVRNPWGFHPSRGARRLRLRRKPLSGRVRIVRAWRTLLVAQTGFETTTWSKLRHSNRWRSLLLPVVSNHSALVAQAGFEPAISGI